MTYFTTKVEAVKNLADELNRLATAGHTIVSVMNHDGKFIIISTTSP